MSCRGAIVTDNGDLRWMIRKRHGHHCTRNLEGFAGHSGVWKQRQKKNVARTRERSPRGGRAGKGGPGDGGMLQKPLKGESRQSCVLGETSKNLRGSEVASRCEGFYVNYGG